MQTRKRLAIVGPWRRLLSFRGRARFYLTLFVSLAGHPVHARSTALNHGEAAEAALAEALRLALGDEVKAAIDGAQAVDVLRLRDELRPVGDPADLKTAGGYGFVRELRVKVPREFEHIRGIFADASEYADLGEHGSLGCGFMPGVAFRFWPTTSRTGIPLDVVVCFHCDQMRFFRGGKGRERLYALAGTSYTELLMLSAAAFPDDEALGETLIESEERDAREKLFWASFPAGAQWLVARGWNPAAVEGARTREQEDAWRAAELLRLVGRDKLLATVARAVIVRQDHSWSPSTPPDLFVRAVAELSASEVASSLASLADEPVALAGAAELYLSGGLTPSNFPKAAQRTWRARLFEAAIRTAPQAPSCSLVSSLVKDQERPLLDRLARGEIREAVHPQSSDTDQATARACALLALVNLDAHQSQSLLASWQPTTTVDRAARWTALYRLGTETPFEAGFLRPGSESIWWALVHAIEARPTRAALDQVMAAMGRAPEKGAFQHARDIFQWATPFKPQSSDDDVKGATTELTTWWEGERDKLVCLKVEAKVISVSPLGDNTPPPMVVMQLANQTSTPVTITSYELRWWGGRKSVANVDLRLEPGKSVTRTEQLGPDDGRLDRLTIGGVRVRVR